MTRLFTASKAVDAPHVCNSTCGTSRRDFLSRSLGCGGFMALTLSGVSVSARAGLVAPVTGKVITTEPWARIEQLSDGIWAIISTPFTDPKAPARQTLSNGGIIAGKDGVMVVEGFNQPVGAAWVGAMAEKLTGRKVTHVVVTHFHADHTAGLAGFQQGANGPDIVATRVTRDLLLDTYAVPTKVKEGEAPPDMAATQLRVMAPTKLITDPSRSVRIDLGGRVVTIDQQSGHTQSDVTIAVEDPRIVWTGDLVFNGLFPYYGDAKPSQWNKTCDAILRDKETCYVPGHGVLATASDLDTYRELLALVGEAAKAAHKAGTPAAQGAAAFKIPQRLGEWYLFSPKVFEFAFDAWYRELG